LKKEHINNFVTTIDDKQIMLGLSSSCGEEIER
jgi:hypothetical protein